jgi:hypothetical protein
LFVIRFDRQGARVIIIIIIIIIVIVLAVRAEIAYLTALRDTQMHDHGLRRWYITELEAADTANH